MYNWDIYIPTRSISHCNFAAHIILCSWSQLMGINKQGRCAKLIILHSIIYFVWKVYEQTSNSIIPPSLQEYLEFRQWQESKREEPAMVRETKVIIIITAKEVIFFWTHRQRTIHCLLILIPVSPILDTAPHAAKENYLDSVSLLGHIPILNIII